MLLKPLTVWLVIVLIVFCTGGFAQQYELSGVIGRTFISDQAIKGATFFNSDVRFGNGFTFEVAPAHRVYGGDFSAFPVTLEMPFVVNWDEHLNTGANVIPSHFRSFFLAPSARFNVAPRSFISPWVSFGGGFAHFSESSTLLYGGANPGPTGTSSGLLQAGAGFDLKIKSRYSLRTEVRDFWSGVPQLNVDTGKTRQHNLFVGSGIVAHF